MPDIQTRRCRNCGALVGADAEWCGQCFASLKEPERQVPTKPPGPPSEHGVQGEAYWPCPVCEAKNPLAVDSCQTCGTPFSLIMQTQARAESKVPPSGALVWSLVFPGLGHHRAGKTMDGVARAILFGVSLSMALLMGLGSLESAITIGVFALFSLFTLAVYAVSAYEAHRLAQGRGLLVPSRVLMWVVVGLIMLSVASLTVAVVTAARR